MSVLIGERAPMIDINTARAPIEDGTGRAKARLGANEHDNKMPRGLFDTTSAHSNAGHRAFVTGHRAHSEGRHTEMA